MVGFFVLKCLLSFVKKLFNIDMKIEEIYQLYLKYPKVVTDSREKIKDSIFFALKGENFNGNKFAHLALENGCKYAIIDEEEYKTDERFILVDNVLSFLQKIANFHRKQLSIPVIGITGTNGKTTTKELLHAVLSQKYNTSATKGNLNNHIGVPLTLLSITSEVEIAIVEMGANHIGEIAELCAIAEPNLGLITNVGMAHLEGFGSFEGIKKTKKELYDFLSNNDGLAFINADNKSLVEMINTQKQISYFSEDKGSANVRFLQAAPFLVIELQAPQKGKLYVKTKLFGAYNYENVLAAISVGRYFNVDDLQIKKALESYEPSNNRSQIKRTDNNVLFLDMYNANPTSMKAAISSFSDLKSKTKVLILGDMRELGDNAEKEHENILSQIKESNLEKVLLVGACFNQLNVENKFLSFETVQELNIYIESNSLMNKYILIKGSRGEKLELCIPNL